MKRRGWWQALAVAAAVSYTHLRDDGAQDAPLVDPYPYVLLMEEQQDGPFHPAELVGDQVLTEPYEPDGSVFVEPHQHETGEIIG